MADAATAARVQALVSRIEKVTSDFESIHDRLKTDSPVESTSNGVSAEPSSPKVNVENFGDLAQRLSRVADKVASIETHLSTPVPDVSEFKSSDSQADEPLSAAPQSTLSPVRPVSEVKHAVASPMSCSGGVSCSGDDFEKLLNELLEPFLAAAKDVGGTVAQQAVEVGKAFESQRTMLKYVARARPAQDDPESQRYLEETSKCLEAVGEFMADKADDLFPHLAMVAGGVHALGWVSIPDEPANYISEALNALPTYGSRIQSRGGAHAVLYSSLQKLLRGLLGYVRKHFANGLGNYPPENTGVPEAEVRVQEYDLLLSTHLTAFVKIADEIGAEVSEQAKAVFQAFKAQRDMMVLASHCKPPTPDELREAVQDTNDAMHEVENANLSDRSHPLFNHTSLVAGGIGALGWVTIALNPDVMISGSLNGLTVYSDKIMSTGSAKDTEFCQNYKALIAGLRAYVEKHHRNGLQWNLSGQDVTTFLEM